MSKKLDDSTTLDIPDDLHLSAINFPKFPKNATVPEHLNEYLRDQLEQAKRENESLHQELAKKKSELKQSQEKIDKLSEKVIDFEGCPKGEFPSSLQIANYKIAELSKKLREKNSEMEVYKSKCLRLENNLSELKEQYENDQETEKEKNEVVDEPHEIKKLQEKLNYITNKWVEEKNMNLKLKNDLKLANKWLQQEVGEKFETLLSFNKSNSSWRGRAQIICDLQQKNQELKEKLRLSQENKGTESPPLNKNDKKAQTLNNENLELKHNYAELKRKFDALKARCKVLEGEQGSLKSKLSDMSNFHETDRQTISKLTLQLTHHNELKNEDLKQRDQLIKKLEQENEALKVELVRERYQSENKTKELLEKNDDIQLLNRRIRSSRPPSSYVRKHENPETKTINRLEVERIRLLELTEVQNMRLGEERNSHLKTQQLLRIEKQKCARLEASLARLQLDQNSARSGYSSKLSTPKQQIENNLQDKLELAEENIKALTTRLEIECLERKRDLQEFSKILNNCGQH